MPLTFRVAEHNDIPSLLDLVHRTYRGDESRLGWTTEADLLDGQRTDHRELTEIIDRPTAVLLVAETAPGAALAADADAPGPDAPALVGCCHLERRPDGTAYLGLFSVSPDHQGGGNGRAIVAEAERRVRDEWRAEAIEMSVIRQRVELIAWYERLGYLRTGAFLPFPYGDERFGLPKQDDLEFEILRKVLTA